MPKTKISEYSTTNSNNTDIESINIDEGCAPSGINNAIRELMVHLKEFQTGSSGDPLTVAGGFVASGGFSANTMTVTGILTASGGTILSSTNTLSGSNIISGNINSSGTTNTFSGGNILSGTNTFSGTNIFSSDVTLNAQSDLRFADSDSSNWVAFQSPATVASNVTWTLPAADGTSNQVLATNGSGTLSWATAGGGASISAGDSKVEVTDTGSNGTIVFNTDGSERMRVDSDGDVGIGTTSPAVKLDVVGTSNAISAAVSSTSTSINAAPSLKVINTGAATANQSAEIQFRFQDGSLNGNGAIAAIRESATGRKQSFIFAPCTNDGTGDPTERMRITSAGDLFVGRTSDADTNGTSIFANGAIRVNKDNGTAGIFNRNTNDGIIISLRQDGTAEGDISVSGTTVSYNGGHLSRWAQMSGTKDDTLVKGTVMSNLDEMNVYTDAEGNPVDNEQLNKVKVSDVEGDVNVAGVFVNWDYDEAHQVDEINMAMTGDMIIRIAQGVVVQKGDLLMSAGDGTAKPQGDDIVRSKTVAKVTSNHVTCTYADGSYCVPCVLMAC